MSRFSIAALLLIALVAHGPRLSQAPLDVAPTRQFSSALAARAIYFRLQPDGVPQWRRDAVEDYMAYATRAEPPVIEASAALVYALVGREALWIPRALSVAYWLVGGYFLFLTARSVSTPDGALVGTAIYLLLPWAVAASDSFQPDPLAVMWMCVDLWALLRYEARPSPGRLLVAALTALPAIFIRLMTAFFLYFVLGVMMLRRHGLRRAVVHPHPWAYVAISILPAAIYYGHGWINDQAVRDRAGAVMVPSLFLETSFWAGWRHMIAVTITPGMFIAALLFLPFALRGAARTLAIGLWLGYIAYGVVFNFQIFTHQYYQTLALPMIALTVAPAVAWFLARLPTTYRRAVLVATVCALVAVLWRSGVIAPHDYRDQLSDYHDVGELTGHSRRVVFLTDSWGNPLRYYGEVSGRYWPTRFEIDMYRPLGDAGIADVPPPKRLDDFSAAVGGAEYFVITDMAEWSRQPDLQTYLDRTFAIVSRTERRIIYDLRMRRMPAGALLVADAR